MTSLRFGLIALALLACSKEDDGREETGRVDTEKPDSQSDSGKDTGEPSAALSISPGEILVDVGSEWQMQATAGAEEVSAVYASSDDGILIVSATGLASAQSVGSAQVEASWEGQSATALVEVQEGGELHVRVFSEQGGEALANSRVMVDGAVSLTDSNGEVTLSVPSGQAIAITVYADPANVYIPALFLDVLPRDLALPLRLRGADDPGKAEMAGNVDLSGTLLSGPDEKAAGLVTIGLAVPSFQQGALFFPLEQLFSANRTLSVEGISVDLPGNLFIRDYGESWEGSAHEGPVSVWAFGGPVPKSGLASGLHGVAEVLAFLVPHFDAFNWTWETDLEASLSAPLQVDLRPDVAFDDLIEVRMPSYPAGLSAETNALLMALSGDRDGGPVLTGMGQGKQTMLMSRVHPDGIDGENGFVLAIVEVGGFGSGGAQTLSLAPVEEGIAQIDSWLNLATMDSFDRDTMTFGMSTDSSADFARIQIKSASGGRRDVYLPPGAHDRVLPTDGPSLGYGSTTWTVLSVDTHGESYEALLSDGGLAPSSLRQSARSTARTVIQFTPEP
jgi:hypothetical protein